MEQSLSRRAFFRIRERSPKPPSRPPWALAEAGFVAACSAECESACIEACPERILVCAADGRPEIRFELGACTFCANCAEACPTGALVKHDACGRQLSPWSLKAVVANRCLAISGITCRACGEACAEDAIVFRLGLNGTALPAVSDDTCTGCGACVKPCPVDAIALVDQAGVVRGAA